MYSSKPRGWAKHADFIVLDILCLQVAFALAYMTRHGVGSPYADELYLNMAAVYTLVDFAIMVVNSTMKNVLKRGFYKEFLHTVKHNFLVTMVISAVLFSAQRTAPAWEPGSANSAACTTAQPMERT